MVDKYSNAGTVWTAEQEKILSELFESGQSLKTMCDKLQRTSAGIVGRLQKLSLIVQADAKYLVLHNWSCIPKEVAKSRSEQPFSEPISPKTLQLPILYNEIAGDRIGFNNFISWVEHTCFGGRKRLGISAAAIPRQRFAFYRKHSATHLSSHVASSGAQKIGAEINPSQVSSVLRERR